MLSGGGKEVSKFLLGVDIERIETILSSLPTSLKRIEKLITPASSDKLGLMIFEGSIHGQDQGNFVYWVSYREGREEGGEEKKCVRCGTDVRVEGLGSTL